jgi:murein DD-endopeptidase MepM/ murein hydrolase activator NlpD
MRNPLQVMRIRGSGGGSNPAHNVFGWVRTYPNGTPKPHQGWDLQATVGTPAFAIAQGKVLSVLNHGDYGLQVILAFAHSGGTKFAHYAHLATVSVTPGQDVTEGTQIGTTGASGNAANLPVAERHLHFEIRTVAHPGVGLAGRDDPGNVLGFSTLSCG